MADHVRIREVDNREIVRTGPYCVDQCCGHAGRAHLGLLVVGSDLCRRHQLAILARERLLASAVEEVGHVRVLLGFGGVELPQTGVRQDLRHRRDLLGGERDEHIGQVDLVVGQGGEREVADNA